MIDMLSSCLALPWEQRNLFVSRPCSLSSQSNFAPSRSLSFSANLSDTFFSKGCLSTSTLQKPIRHSVVCMSKKYAPNTDKRKILSRKRGGNSDKKRNRRKGGKKKVFKIVRLVSAAGTGFFYTKKKSRKISNKLRLEKYDPLVKHHVLFEEVK